MIINSKKMRRDLSSGSWVVPRSWGAMFWNSSLCSLPQQLFSLSPIFNATIMKVSTVSQSKVFLILLKLPEALLFLPRLKEVNFGKRSSAGKLEIHVISAGSVFALPIT
jgi:hypothetical protein